MMYRLADQVLPGVLGVYLQPIQVYRGQPGGGAGQASWTPACAKKYSNEVDDFWMLNAIKNQEFFQRKFEIFDQKLDLSMKS